MRFQQLKDPTTGESYLKVESYGIDLKNDPILNKGTCFTLEEREQFGLEAQLPPVVSTPEEQQARAYGNYCQVGDEVGRYLFLTALQDRNETLFYRLLLDHMDEMTPVVYTPTVGKACQQYSRIYRRPRGVYITPNQRGRIKDVLRNAPVDGCKVMVVTDNEAILGLGDLGVGGMGIPIGKLTLYTAGAGIHPATCLPVDLDVGTNNQELLDDPLYLGIREPRLTGDDYLSFVDEFVEAVVEVFPGALVQWEDFANENAFVILERYRDRVLSFDDDMQGTGAVVVAGIQASLRQAGRDLSDERAVFYGAGAAGGGCALALRAAMCARGVPARQARDRILCLDSRGLILDDRPGLGGHKAAIAADTALVQGWSGGQGGTFRLLDVVRNFRPTILVGMAGRPGAFSEEIVRCMAAQCGRPTIFPLSNPTSMAEALPSDLLAWTGGGAIIATGSPFDPVELGGVTYEIGQANNALIFPGAGLGALAVEARQMPEEVFLAAAKALVLAAEGEVRRGASLFPPLTNLRRISRRVAIGVGRSLVASGAAPERSDTEIEKRIDDLIWEPVYLPYRYSRTPRPGSQAMSRRSW